MPEFSRSHIELKDRSALILVVERNPWFNDWSGFSLNKRDTP